MFQSYKVDSRRLEIIIVDSEFQSDPFPLKINLYTAENIINGIIIEYSKRKLDVARNLSLFIEHLSKEYPKHYSADCQITCYLRHVDKFKDYLPEIRKYLLFS